MDGPLGLEDEGTEALCKSGSLYESWFSLGSGMIMSFLKFFDFQNRE